MVEYSLFETNNRYRQEQAFGIALGRVVSVNAEERVCAVSTFGGCGSMDDQYIARCQWLSPDISPEGDELGFVPRVGSIGLVFFVNAQAFIWGFIRPLWKGGTAAKGDEKTVPLDGDKFLSSVNGNRISVKRSGVIELYTSGTLQRIMSPRDGSLTEICKRYNLRCMEGGRLDWEADPITETSLYRAEYVQSQLRAFIVTQEIGYVSPTILYRLKAGPGVNFSRDILTPSFEQTIGVAGEITTKVTPPTTPVLVGCETVMSPTGKISVKAGAAKKTTVDISPSGAVDISVNDLAKASISAAGEIELASNKLHKITISPKGDIVITNPSSTITMSSTGDVTVDTKKKVTMTALAGIDVKNTTATPINIESLGEVTVKAKSINLKGGLGAVPLQSVLTTPAAISDFTGKPIMMGSQTVKASI